MIEVTGVSTKQEGGKWMSNVYIDGVKKYLGEFTNYSNIEELYRIEMNIANPK